MKKAREIQLLLIFLFSHGIVLMWRLYCSHQIWAAEETRFLFYFFSTLFLSSTIAILTFIFSDKRNLAFLSVQRLISCAKIFRNCTMDNKGLKSNKFDASRIDECVPLSYKFKFRWEWFFCWIPFVRLFSKLLRCKISCRRLSRFLNRCGVLQPLLLFCSYI